VGRDRGRTFVDLFAGCGGLAHGFVREGFTPVGAVEIDEDACETYRLNIDKAIYSADIASIDLWPTAQVVIGGPPCQGFSQLGTRDPDDPRNRLWRQYARVVKVTGAQVFVMENVPQLLRSSQYEQFYDEMTRSGFKVTADVLNAADYGVPQTRRRAIVIGSRLGQPDLPEKSHGPQSRSKRPPVDVRTALAGLPLQPTGKDWHRGRDGIRPDSIVRYKAVPPSGGNRFQMQEKLERSGLGHLVPNCWRNKVSGTTDVFGRMWWDKPAPTIRTEFFKPEKGRYLHPVAHRPITVREAARLQSFPDDFLFAETQAMNSVARQIGNAVPPVLAAAIARAVAEHLRTHGQPLEGVVASRSGRHRELVPVR